MIGGFSPFDNFHKPSAYAKKRYWFIGFPLIGTFLIVLLVYMYVGDAIHYILTPKRWKGRKR